MTFHATFLALLQSFSQSQLTKDFIMAAVMLLVQLLLLPWLPVLLPADLQLWGSSMQQYQWLGVAGTAVSLLLLAVRRSWYLQSRDAMLTLMQGLLLLQLHSDAGLQHSSTALVLVITAMCAVAMHGFRTRLPWLLVLLLWDCVAVCRLITPSDNSSSWLSGRLAYLLLPLLVLPRAYWLELSAR